MTSRSYSQSLTKPFANNPILSEFFEWFMSDIRTKLKRADLLAVDLYLVRVEDKFLDDFLGFKRRYLGHWFAPETAGDWASFHQRLLCIIDTSFIACLAVVRKRITHFNINHLSLLSRCIAWLLSSQIYIVFCFKLCKDPCAPRVEISVKMVLLAVLFFFFLRAISNHLHHTSSSGKIATKTILVKAFSHIHHRLQPSTSSHTYFVQTTLCGESFQKDLSSFHGLLDFF